MGGRKGKCAELGEVRWVKGEKGGEVSCVDLSEVRWGRV